jgi:uncharacterized protein
MRDGRLTPAAHDGMAAFGHRRKIRLVRNHEVRGAATAFGPPEVSYDGNSGGGNTIIEFDPRGPGNPVSWGVLSGTTTNCAGGATPWGSWLTCEETVEVQGKPHGFVYEAPSSAEGFVQATPLTHLGRFVHEALAVEPNTGIIYLTEDAGATSGFYRHVPVSKREPLAPGGQLQMLSVVGMPNFNLGASFTAGDRFEIEWVDIANPNPNLPAEATVFQQDTALGGAASADWRVRSGPRGTRPSTSTPPTVARPRPARCGRGSAIGAGSSSSWCTSRPPPTRCSSRTTTGTGCSRTSRPRASRSPSPVPGTPAP